MSNQRSVKKYKTMNRIVELFRNDLQSKDYILLYAYNGTGKTRLSMEFKNKGKMIGASNGTGKGDTLYFNAFTEDLFTWDNDLEDDTNRKLCLNKDSKFFNVFDEEIDLENKIRAHLIKYTDFDFKIQYEAVKGEEVRTVSFSRNEIYKPNNSSELSTRTVDNIKISRGEENLFIWCTFLAICELAIDRQEGYDWVNYIYIDDPISSLDENNVIAIASDLAILLREAQDNVKVLISTHHGLFFNIMTNELKKHNHKCYFLYKNKHTNEYQLQTTGDTPFFYHVAMLKELHEAAHAIPSKLYTYHFNILRSIMEKTASFFGAEDFSFCMKNIDNEKLFSRALNLMSHGQYSVYEPRKMLPDNQKLFKDILDAFLENYPFQLPNLGEAVQPATSTSTQTATPQEIQS
ncbi:TPA: AAA family ATPase [Acinetobacter baumannii]|uniref:AAA family ATPase n=1 Tax=Acinetobacter baumannii TaxID=470 RepID=UPI003EEA862E